MKITKAQLKQIIKEELSAVLDKEIVEEEEQPAQEPLSEEEAPQPDPTLRPQSPLHRAFSA